MATFNMNKIALEDVDFFLAPQLKEFNNYNMLIYFHDSSLIHEFMHGLRNVSAVQICQECGSDYAKLSFASHVKLTDFLSYVSVYVEKFKKTFAANKYFCVVL